MDQEAASELLRWGKTPAYLKIVRWRKTMPLTYQVRPDERLVILSHVGAVTDDEFLSFYKALYENPEFDKSFNLLVDLRQAESYLRSPAALDRFAEFIQGQYGKASTKLKVAVIAPEDISFGLARMYQIFSKDVPWEFAVFRAGDAALAWLGLSENLINHVEQNAQPEDSPDF